MKRYLCYGTIISILSMSTNSVFALTQKSVSVNNSVKKQYSLKKENIGFKNKVVQAESGKVSGKAIKNGNRVGYIGNGEENSLTITVNSEANVETEVKMTLGFISGENRNLSYKVNNTTPNTIKNLNSGNWNETKKSEYINIKLKPGENTIKFYLEEGFAPDIDYIIFSLEELQSNYVYASFVSDGNELKEPFKKDTKSIIDISEIPENPTKEGKEFLGWFWGEDLKYEAKFPLDLSKIPKDILESLLGDMTFVAKFGNNQPPSKVEKEGYRLIFQEEFNEDKEKLDNTKFVEKYLSSWSLDYKNTNEYNIKDGKVSIEIKETTKPWCEEFDGKTVVSGFTTGNRNGLHNWNNGKNIVRNPSDTELTHINQYGYYEIRAKGQPGSSRHSAWWLLGFEDIPEESAEIDIFEVLGKDNNTVPPAVHKWNDENAFETSISGAYNNPNKDFNNEWHTYGLEWEKGTGSSKFPDKLIFYVDGEKYKELNVNIDYPMIQLFSLYEKREGGWTGPWEWMPYPNSFEIDYIRVYKKLPEGQNPIPNEQLKVVDIKAQDISLKKSQVELKKYEGTDYIEKNLPGTKSYVRVYWNDGVETQEAVQWEPITEKDLKFLREGYSIVKKGKVNSINQKVEMKINIIDGNGKFIDSNILD